MKSSRIGVKLLDAVALLEDVQTEAEAFGFRLSRISGSHHIYVHADVSELVNLQNVNGQAKPYQVKQLLRLIERYNLQMEEEP